MDSDFDFQFASTLKVDFSFGLEAGFSFDFGFDFGFLSGFGCRQDGVEYITF